MGILSSLRSTALACGTAAILALCGCGGGSSGAVGSSGGGAAPGGPGNLNLAITDAPSDAWQQVTVQLESASLVPQGSSTPVQVWPPSGTTPPATYVNLVDLNQVATLLGTVSAPPGSYSRLQLAINADPATMTLVDDNGTTIPAADITVKGQVSNGAAALNVDLQPAFVVPASGTATLQADFNLAHPLSIVETTYNGTTQVVLNLQVRFKALPGDLRTLQFTRKLGKVAGVAAPDFTLTDSSNNTFTYLTDSGTLFYDADTHAAGSLSGLSGEYALVASNLNADGSLYARRVWYAGSAAALPQWTPEGLVRRVFPAQDRFIILSQATATATGKAVWAPQQVLVDDQTAWTYAGTVTMGTGTAFLKDLWRGCRVDVQLDSTGHTATSVNVESAYDEGFISSVTGTGLTFGFAGFAGPDAAQGLACGLGDLAARAWNFYQPATGNGNTFSWWYFGLPSSADPAVADLQSVIAASQTAKLPVAGYANLYWDTASGTWQVYQLVLEPEQLRTSVITSAYADGGQGSGTLGVTCLSPRMNFAATSTLPMTLTLDYSGDLQTLVESATYSLATRTFVFIAPVPSSDWAALLVPPPTGTFSADQIWVRPVLDSGSIDWHAYTVQQFSVQ